MPKYRRQEQPEESVEALREYLDDELQQLEEASEFATEVRLEELHVEPKKPRKGMIVLADGTNWDPGSGAGYYGYRDGAWRALE